MKILKETDSEIILIESFLNSDFSFHKNLNYQILFKLDNSSINIPEIIGQVSYLESSPKGFLHLFEIKLDKKYSIKSNIIISLLCIENVKDYLIITPVIYGEHLQKFIIHFNTRNEQNNSYIKGWLDEILIDK